MTLEDFFTLTEMKNGLTTLSRVEELISILQQQKDCVMSNVGDTARQWSSVASTLAATDNKDCLKHFVQLNGLFYLNQWLQESLKCSNDIVDNAVEEFLNALLGSLERLPIYREELVSSGIQLTVEQLLDFKSLNIKERARALSERWKHAEKNDVSYQDTNKDESCKDESKGDGEQSLHVVIDSSTCIEQADKGNSPEESAGSERHNNTSSVAEFSEASQPVKTDDILTSTTDQNLFATANANLGDKTTLPSTLIVSNSNQENSSGIEESSVCPTPGDADDGHCDAPQLKDDRMKDMNMQVDIKEGSPCESDQKESCKVPSSSGLSISAVVQKPVRSISCNFDFKEKRSPTVDTVQTLPRSASIDFVAPKYLSTMEIKRVMQDVLSTVSKPRKADDLETLNREEDTGNVSEVKELVCTEGVDTVIPDSSPRKAEKNISTVEMDQRSELGLEYGEIDALEVARQVAIAVEREVVDYREPFCSPSPEGNSGEVTDIVEEAKKDQPLNEENNGSVQELINKDDPDGASSSKDENLRISEANMGPDKSEQDAETSKPVTHISADNNDNSRCDFDLNQDLCVEEPDCLINPVPNNSVISVPIAVTASKGSPPFLVSPLRFEGEPGWKGSAATSAFRPTSSRKTPDTEKTSSGHKRKANFFEIDLNVAESGDDAADPLSSSIKPIPVSTGIPSREDSVEVSSKRADRLKLDLNRLGDEDLSPHPSTYCSLPRQNGDKTMSPASSSSSRQPSMRDFDLNDNPNFFDAMGSHNLSKSSSTVLSGMYGSSKPDNPVITIMGSRITERKDCFNAVSQSTFSVDAAAAAMASRPMIPFGHYPIPAYGYNGPVMGPPMPFPTYMVDSRGTTVVPQILGSPGLSSASPSMPPFLMSVSNAPPGLNGAGTSHSGLDLNSGIMSMEMGSREGEGFKHLYMQGRNGLMEDEVRDSSQPGGAAGLSLNRKEAESGWEPYTFGYKQVTSWQ